MGLHRSEATAFDSQELRRAFGVYPTGVTVITCSRPNGAPLGVTANSFVSLSLSPALVSVAFHTAARHLAVFLECRMFVVNVLTAHQHELSRHFAQPSECSWEAVQFRRVGGSGIVLDGVAAWFRCQLIAHHPAGDHGLLVGQIEEFMHDATTKPLAFLRGRYGTFQPSAHTPEVDALELWGSITPTVGWS